MKLVITAVAVLKVMLVATLLVAQQPTHQGPICDGTEVPCSEDRPWMRGTVEKSCAPPAYVEMWRRQNPGKIVESCECDHRCDWNDEYEYSDETDGRIWSARCAARCSPSGCTCMSECDS